MTDENPNPLQARHHYLLVGKVVFVDPENGSPQAIDLNGILLTDTTVLNVSHIGQMQQTLGYQANSKLEIPDLKILDVILLNWIYMGYQTKEQFTPVQAPPTAPIVEEVEMIEPPQTVN